MVVATDGGRGEWENGELKGPSFMFKNEESHEGESLR